MPFAWELTMSCEVAELMGFNFSSSTLRHWVTLRGASDHGKSSSWSRIASCQLNGLVSLGFRFGAGWCGWVTSLHPTSNPCAQLGSQLGSSPRGRDVRPPASGPGLFELTQTKGARAGPLALGSDRLGWVGHTPLLQGPRHLVCVGKFENARWRSVSREHRGHPVPA